MIVIFDSSIYIFDLINIFYRRNIILFQIFRGTVEQLSHSYSYHHQTICAAEKGSNLLIEFTLRFFPLLGYPTTAKS